MNGIIVGGGIIGSAVAYELARRGVTDLHVLDPDLDGEWSSTERNAGGVRHLWMNRVNMDLARCSITLFNHIATEIGFQKKGYLWLFSNENKGDGEATLSRALKNGLDYQQLNLPELRERYPFLDKTDDLAFGLFGARDGLINSNGLKQYYREQAKAKGVKFHDRTWVQSVKESAQGAEVIATVLPSRDPAVALLKDPDIGPVGEARAWKADFVVLCAGAWMAKLLAGLIEQPMVQPIRRQISFFKAEDLDLADYGMVVDTSRVYFHAEGGNILAGFVLKDEKPAYRFDYDSDFFETHIWPALYERSSKFEKLREVSGWGGLYSYTPDTSGILGRLPGHRKVIEAHSFTGRGVMQSYGAAVAVTDLILEGKFIHIDAQGLTRERFNAPKQTWLFEGLHI